MPARGTTKAAPAKSALGKFKTSPRSAKGKTGPGPAKAAPAAKATKAPAKSAPAKAAPKTEAKVDSKPSAVYIVLDQTADGSTVRSLHWTLGTARRAGKDVGTYIPGQVSGTPIDNPSWTTGEDKRSWRLEYATGHAVVVQKHKVSE
jgi:hypothetical protein